MRILREPGLVGPMGGFQIFSYVTAVVLQGSVVPARLDVRQTDHGVMDQRGNRPISRSSFDDLVRISFA